MNNTPESFTKSEHAAWLRMKRLLEETQKAENACTPAPPPFRCSMEWPPRENAWLSGMQPEDMAEQARLLEAVAKTLPHNTKWKRLRASELRLSKCVQTRAFLSACRKWSESIGEFFASHP